MWGGDEVGIVCASVCVCVYVCACVCVCVCVVIGRVMLLCGESVRSECLYLGYHITPQ